MSPRGTVLSLFDRSGVMVQPWLDAGFMAWTVDTSPSPTTHPNRVHIQVDIREWSPPSSKQFRMVFAFPPCTHLANSGARWFKSKGLSALIEGLTLVERARSICEASDAPYMIENPVGQLSTYWREPDHRFDPCDYGGYQGGENDDYTKRTLLWCGGGFVIPEPNPISHQGSRMHFLPPTQDRADLRSITPKGFARAVFEANVNHQVNGVPVVLPQVVPRRAIDSSNSLRIHI